MDTDTLQTLFDKCQLLHSVSQMFDDRGIDMWEYYAGRILPLIAAGDLDAAGRALDASFKDLVSEEGTWTNDAAKQRFHELIGRWN